MPNLGTSPFSSTTVASHLPLLTSPSLTLCRKKLFKLRWGEAGVVAEEAHDRKLQKSLAVCVEQGIHFVPLAWESTGGATATVHETVRKWSELEGARGGYPAYLIRRNLYAQISCCLQRHLQAVIDRRLEVACDALWVLSVRC